MNPDELRAGRVAEGIAARRLVVVLRRIEPRDRLIALALELADAGARVFEVTFDAPTAAGDIAALRRHLGLRGDGPYLVGAGTVLRREELDQAQAAGAHFGVAPVLDVALVRAAIEAGLPFVPGAMTPSEVVAGWSAGATFVKVFPASAVGPAFVRELRGPLPDVRLIPTGGVDASNAAAFLDAGAAAVGIGSAIVRAEPAARRALVGSLLRASRP